jgi:hypothetical protein
MTQQEKQINVNSNNDNSSMYAKILGQGDIYFFYKLQKSEESGLSYIVNQGSRAILEWDCFLNQQLKHYLKNQVQGLAKIY